MAERLRERTSTTDEAEFLERVLDSNPCLGGLADAREGDPLTGLERRESYRKIVKVESIDELYEKLRSGLQGAFMYRDLVFFNDLAYGCFVYRYGDPEEYVEHLSLPMSKDEFNKIVRKLLTKSE